MPDVEVVVDKVTIEEAATAPTEVCFSITGEFGSGSVSIDLKISSEGDGKRQNTLGRTSSYIYLQALKSAFWRYCQSNFTGYGFL